MLSHIENPKIMAPIAFRRVPCRFHSVAIQTLLGIAFRSDFGGFGNPNWTPKSMFEMFFWDAFFECVVVSIFALFI